MAEFKPFSLNEANRGAEQSALSFAKVQNIATQRDKASKTAVLRQRIAEGDEDALGELIGLDPEAGKQTFQAMKALSDEDREIAIKRNEAFAKAGIYVMQGTSPEDKQARYTQSLEHMKANGQDISQFPSEFNEQVVGSAIAQSQAMDFALKATVHRGAINAVDKDGNPIIAAQNQQTGGLKIVGERAPKKGEKGFAGGSGSGSRKASDSNAIAKRIATHLGAKWKDDGQGGMTYEFKTDKQSRLHGRLAARAEKIFRDNPNILHGEASQEAIRQLEAIEKEAERVKEETKDTVFNDKSSLKDKTGDFLGIL